MDIGVLTSTEVTKKLFKLKPLRNDGLLLKIHHTTKSKKIRFIHGCFHHFDKILAVGDTKGNIFLIDYSLCKFWGLPCFGSCAFIEFSPITPKHILVGLENGDIIICDIDTGSVQHKLIGHKLPVTFVSFAKQKYILTATKLEAFIWDMETVTKLQVLNLEPDCSLKYISFVPFSGKILGCFQDDLIQIWSHENFENIKQILPNIWQHFSIKCFTFTKNGEFMVVSGYNPCLVIFHLYNTKIVKIIDLTDYLISIKHIEFVSQAFDGGCNKILSILSGQGVIYFFDVEQNERISELRCRMEINRIVSSPEGSHLICLLCSGEVEIFDIKQYVMPPEEVHVHRIPQKWKINRKRCLSEVKFVKQQIESMLDIRKLKYILKEHYQYPEAFRMKIWEHLLHLPNNIYKFNSVINHITIVAFKDLYDKYPLEDKLFLKALKRVLNNLVTWCPFFAHVEYLPIFAFPFVKVFHNKPVACFETLCTVIMNWCQHWFEYFPLPPINILAIIENVLLEHDPELLHHFVTKNVTSNIYVWSLLETVFSEVLTSQEWLIVWDHIVTNEVSFLICVVVAYNIVERHTLMGFNEVEEFSLFFKNQNPIDIKKLIKTSYCILNNTTDRYHPRQYMNKFAKISKDNYPLFFEYPKNVVELQEEEINKIDKHMIKLLTNEQQLAGIDKKSIQDVITKEMKEEEKKRLREIEMLCSNQIQRQQLLLDQEQKRLERMRTYNDAREREDRDIMENVLRDTITSYRSKSEIKSRHKEKLHMAVNVDLLSRFIRKLDIELKKNGGQRTSNEEGITVKKNELRQNDYKPERVSDTMESASTFQECKFHGNDICCCYVSCPKTVRFTSSTTGGSTENVY